MRTKELGEWTVDHDSIKTDILHVVVSWDRKHFWVPVHLETHVVFHPMTYSQPHDTRFFLGRNANNFTS